MLISHRKKFIFIHIYKTAGTSVSAVFLPYSRLADRLAYQMMPTIKVYALISRIMGWENEGMKRFTGYHKHASAVDVREKLGKARFESYFKFSFVRNPFDHTVSLYHYILQTPRHFLFKEVTGKDFESFLTIYLETNPRRQVDFLYDPESGERIVDFVGRVETIEADMENVTGRIGIEDYAGMPHRNRSLRRESKDYRSYYGERSRSEVEAYFRRDIEQFSYTF